MQAKKVRVFIEAAGIKARVPPAFPYKVGNTHQIVLSV
jgi:hypothetical protein